MRSAGGGSCALVWALLLTGCATDAGLTGNVFRNVSGNEVSTKGLEGRVEAVMEKASVAGLSCTVINDLEIAYSRSFGYKNAEARSPADVETVFAAASLSKTIFAYLVASLAGERHLDLDTPLVDYLDAPLSDYPRFADLAGDERTQEITAREVLCHTTGLPNSRLFMPGSKLGFLFEPGERFSYSAEAFELLQLVVEEVMGKGIEELSRQRVFGPFGMLRTSFEWKDHFESDHALPHDRWMRPHFFRHRAPSAAGSMVTTSADFARFVIGNIAAARAQKGPWKQMFEIQVPIHSESMFGPGASRDSGPGTVTDLGWGLGWGLFGSGHDRAIFRTGHGDGIQNYTVVFPEIGTGVVLLSNSDNFESVAAELVELILGDSSSPYAWLGYVPFDPASVSEPPKGPTPVDVDERILERYEGTYEMADFDRTYFKVLNGSLYCSSDNRYWEAMSAASPTKFFFRNYPYVYEFVDDGSDRVVRMDLVIEAYGLRIPSRRLE